MTMTRAILLASVLLVACGGNGGGSGDGNTVDSGSTTNPVIDGGNTNPPIIDARIPADCTPGATQCSDCADNDGDGRADGFDPECTSAADNNEGSFATGIPGDNVANSGYQDCFYDGNSGSGNDGCRIPDCCLLDPNAAGCPPSGESCAPTQMCIDTCLPAVAPGCDCFGCCTICTEAAGCHTVVTNPALAPNCTEETIDDPSKCPVCTPNETCGQPCDPANCILCPGQDPTDLPAECNGQTTCPDGATVCAGDSECAATEYCASGCCVTNIIIN